MKKTTLILFAFALILGVSSCKEKDSPTLGEAPTEADAAFTHKASAANANIIEFTASKAGFTYKWDFANGSVGEGATAQASYPSKGSYDVILTVFNSGGSASHTETVEIADDDASLLNNPLFTLLTGGAAGGGSKTWVIDSTRAGHFGVGKSDGLWPEHWAAQPGDKANSGLYSDKYTFKLNGFKFDQLTGGSVFLNDDQMGNFPGSYKNADDATAPYADQLDQNWNIVEGDKDTAITISGGAFIGFFTGTRTYQILKLTENELYVKYLDSKDATLSWFVRLVPKDYPIDGGGGGKVNTSTLALPFGFETNELDMKQWESFGNSTLERVDNPMSSGINTSSKVIKTVHGDQTWSGIAVTLKDKLNFSGTKKSISLKVLAPVAGEFRIKIEDFATGKIIIERDVNVTKANEWEEISIDFGDAVINTYDKIALFPGWNIVANGTFYIDDIAQK